MLVIKAKRLTPTRKCQFFKRQVAVLTFDWWRGVELPQMAPFNSPCLSSPDIIEKSGATERPLSPFLAVGLALPFPCSALERSLAFEFISSIKRLTSSLHDDDNYFRQGHNQDIFNKCSSERFHGSISSKLDQIMTVDLCMPNCQNDWYSQAFVNAIYLHISSKGKKTQFLKRAHLLVQDFSLSFLK